MILQEGCSLNSLHAQALLTDLEAHAHCSTGPWGCEKADQGAGQGGGVRTRSLLLRKRGGVSQRPRGGCRRLLGWCWPAPCKRHARTGSQESRKRYVFWSDGAKPKSSETWQKSTFPCRSRGPPQTGFEAKRRIRAKCAKFGLSTLHRPALPPPPQAARQDGGASSRMLCFNPANDSFCCACRLLRASWRLTPGLESVNLCSRSLSSQGWRLVSRTWAQSGPVPFMRAFGFDCVRLRIPLAPEALYVVSSSLIPACPVSGWASREAASCWPTLSGRSAVAPHLIGTLKP